MSRIRVAIESPYKPYGITPGTPEYLAGIAKNEAFAEAACLHALEEGYNPFAMHLHFTRFLQDHNAEHRALGIQCGLGWTDFAEQLHFCLRSGEVLTGGMVQALARNLEMFPGRLVRFKLFDWNHNYVRDTTEEEVLDSEYS